MLFILLHTFFDQSCQKSCHIVLEQRILAFLTTLKHGCILLVSSPLSGNKSLFSIILQRFPFSSGIKAKLLLKIYKTFHSSWPWDFLNLFPTASLFHSDFNTRPPCCFTHIMDPSVSENLLRTFPLTNSALPGNWSANRLSYFTALLNYLLHESFLDTQNRRMKYR